MQIADDILHSQDVLLALLIISLYVFLQFGYLVQLHLFAFYFADEFIQSHFHPVNRGGSLVLQRFHGGLRRTQRPLNLCDLLRQALNLVGDLIN